MKHCGSVSVRDITDGLNEPGAGVLKSMIVLERAIKALGGFNVRVVLHPEVTVMVEVNIARSDDEAAAEADGGLSADARGDA